MNVEEKPHLCRTCGDAYAKVLDLNIHRCLRHGAQKFQCDKCDASYQYESQLRRHKRTHLEKSNEKPYVCQLCDCAYSEKRALKQHNRIHTGERPYTCRECGATFRIESCLHKHFLVHTGATPVKCNICGAGFSNKRGLTAHGFVHTGKKPYTCKICGCGFSFAHSLRKHTRNKHSEDNEPIGKEMLSGFEFKRIDDFGSGWNDGEDVQNEALRLKEFSQNSEVKQCSGEETLSSSRKPFKEDTTRSTNSTNCCD